MTVYMIEMVGHDLVKIGKTNNVSARLSTLQTGSPYELRLFAVFCGLAECSNQGLESDLHRTFDHLRVRGEWFRFTDELRVLKDALDPPHAIDDVVTFELTPVTSRSAFAESPFDFCKACGFPIGCELAYHGTNGRHFTCPEPTA